MSIFHERVFRWLAGGRTGISSETMLYTHLGVDHRHKFSNYPYDPADFNRCLMMLALFPEVKNSFDKIAAICPVWRLLIENWDKIESTFLDEAGLDWEKSDSAPKTYELIRALINEGQS